MNDDRHDDAANGVPISRGSLRQQVTGRLLVGIFQGRLRSGQRLVVQQLADLFRVSPTPVRESLVELASLGLVDLAPNRGAVVRPFGPKEVREISQVRRVLEVEATRCAAGRIEPAAIASLEHELASLHDRAPGPAWDRLVRDLDTRLHGLIARSCGSDRLGAEINRYLDLFRTLRDVSHHRDSGTNYSRSNDLPEHLEIVRALHAGDADEAARAMDRHIRSAARSLEEVVFGGPVPARAGPVASPGPFFAED
jgi:DNA-binding GntR family transcriptional regulator